MEGKSDRGTKAGLVARRSFRHIHALQSRCRSAHFGWWHCVESVARIGERTATFATATKKLVSCKSEDGKVKQPSGAVAKRECFVVSTIAHLWCNCRRINFKVGRQVSERREQA